MAVISGQSFYSPGEHLLSAGSRDDRRTARGTALPPGWGPAVRGPMDGDPACRLARSGDGHMTVAARMFPGRPEQVTAARRWAGLRHRFGASANPAAAHHLEHR